MPRGTRPLRGNTLIPASRQELPPQQLLALITLVGLATGLHLLHLNTWVSAFFLCMVFLRLLAVYRPGILPGRLLLFLLTSTGLFNVISHYPLVIGKQGGVALLTTMVGLKLLETKKGRDLYVLVFLGFFMLATQFLYRQDMPLVILALLILIGLTGVLVNGNRAHLTRNPFATWLTSGSLLVQALPLMLIMFVLFPRFSSPLWELGIREQTAVTGISDNITPGSISRLVRSGEPAFRVEFEADQIPTQNQRYWRGPVLWDTDGKNWVAGEQIRETVQDYQVRGEAIRYSVTLEPTDGKWLFVLDLPYELPDQSTLTPDFQLVRNDLRDQRVRYSASSYLSYATGSLSSQQRMRGLQLPNNVTPRIRELARHWRQESGSDGALVNRALDYFNEQPFHYTLYPELLEENPIDEFLFESRRGFCEHYATSFTLLMRVAGIPARVVAGYQGGETNPFGGHLLVKQSDAHAWSEVWLSGKGWVRVDPTAAVAPERIERSLDIDQINEEVGAPIRFDLENSALLEVLIKQFRWGIDAIDASWHRWVLGYTQERQSYLMDLIGLGFLKGGQLVYAMVAITALAITLLTLVLLTRGKKKPDSIVAGYQLFCERLKRRGISRRSYEGPRDYGQRVIHLRPDLRDQVEPILSLYIGIRYGLMDTDSNRRQLRGLIRRFKPSASRQGQ
ncbi:MAG: DUF3488 domain-containing transglutaminase family protein [Gammaproteobacteria bacterium]|nr:DUF3488 domain-containing transglutaminase family protein [Gammaproteobacteria bacterium]